jgi:5-methylcytosine-specific restriction endonuclease McrA
MPQRSATYTGNKGGECNAVERLAHCLRCDFMCPYCGCDLKRANVISMDHVVAQVWGGTKSDRNIVACCGSCNSSKKHKLLRDFAAGRGDIEILRRVRRITNRKLSRYMTQAERIIGEQDETPE